MSVLVREPFAFVDALERARARGDRVGLVLTMGALHEGHIALVHEARARGAGYVALSIFVNPLQFGPTEDFARYPRTLGEDLARCREARVDLVFAPEREVLVPDGMQAFVEVPAIAAPLEGRFRPGHFRGVATIVTKLFALGGPCVAPFGRKDYQQWRLVERLARDLFPHVEVVGVRTVREDDGLAMSSRNRYLDATQRERARGIVLGLRAAHAAFAAGERRVERLERCAREPVEGRFDAIDYVAVVDPESLQPLEGGLVRGRALLAVAARLGTTRLIDNTVLGEEPPP